MAFNLYYFVKQQVTKLIILMDYFIEFYHYSFFELKTPDYTSVDSFGSLILPPLLVIGPDFEPG